MIYGDDEYQRQIDVINAIPSNKVDVPNLENITKQGMREFEKRHLIEMTEQARCMDADEQMATARGLRIEILHNAIGEYITRMEQKNNDIKKAVEK